MEIVGGLGTLGLMWYLESEVEETLAKLQSEVWKVMLTWLVKSYRLASVRSIVQKHIVIEKFSKLAVRRSKKEGSNPNDYYFGRDYRSLERRPWKVCFRHLLLLL